MSDTILVIILTLNLVLLCLFAYFFISAFVLRVPYIPTKKKLAKKMVELANIQKGQKVFDLGCGDGRLLFVAEEEGAECIGIEKLKLLVWWGKLKSKMRNQPVEFRHGDFNKTDLSEADVIFCYLFPKLMDELFQAKFSELKKGARIISNAFRIKELVPKEKVRYENSWIYVYEKS